MPYTNDSKPTTSSGLPFAFVAANQQVISGGLSNTLSLTTSGSDRLLVVYCSDDALGTTTVTYGGVPMTAITTQNDTSNFFKLSAFYLKNPTVGANNIVATRTLATGDFYVFGMTYKNAGQDTVPHTFTSSAQTAGTSQTVSLTTTAASCWTTLFTFADGGGLAASTGSTLRGAVLNTAAGVFDSGAALSVGANSMRVTMGSGLRTSIMLAFESLATQTNDRNPSLVLWDDSYVTWDSALSGWDTVGAYTFTPEPTGSYTLDNEPT
jgi:hypothetical protein